MSAPRRSARLQQKNAQQQALAGASVVTSGLPTNKDRPASKPSRKRKRERPTDEIEATHVVRIEKAARGLKRSASEPAVPVNPSKKPRNHLSDEGENNDDQQLTSDRNFPRSGDLPDDVNLPHTAQANAPLSVEEEGIDFLEALISVIEALRLLDEKRAAQERLMNEKSQLHTLLNWTHPVLLNLPDTEEHRAEQNTLRANIERYNRHLAQREEQDPSIKNAIAPSIQLVERRKDRLDEYFQPSAILPDLPCLEGNFEFQDAFERCQFFARTLANVKTGVNHLEQDMSVIEDRVRDHNRRLAARAQELMKKPVPQQPTSIAETNDEESTFTQDSKRYLELSKQLQELEAEAQRTKQAFSDHKDALARIGESQMEKVGLHIPPLTEQPATPLEHLQRPESPNRDAEKPDHHASAQVLEATTNNLCEPTEEEKVERDDLEAEIMHAKEQLERARREFDDGRRLTAIERALLLPPYTEDNLGATMALKLSRVTRNLIDAEQRVSELRAAARLAGLVERYPEDQTWDFEDRSDDGYADSVFAARAEKARPDVEEWIPRLAEPEDMLTPATHPRAPKSRPDVGIFELGEDSADGFPGAEHRQRIVDFRQKCEQLRQTKHFPRTEPDRIIPAQQSRHLNSHMI